MDVLEHLGDDRKNLEKLLNENLLSQGLIFITVPAYSFLWSSHDIRLEHKKRYNRKELREVVSFENSTIEYCQYGFSFMLIPLLLIRKWDTFFNKEPKVKGIPQVGKWVNAVLYFLGKLEFLLGGASFGTSLFCIIRKRS
jgi:hypothetical protein